MLDETDFENNRSSRCLRIISNLDRIFSDPCFLGVVVFFILMAMLYFSLRLWEKKVMNFFLK